MLTKVHKFLAGLLDRPKPSQVVVAICDSLNHDFETWKRGDRWTIVHKSGRFSLRKMFGFVDILNAEGREASDLTDADQRLLKAATQSWIDRSEKFQLTTLRDVKFS